MLIISSPVPHNHYFDEVEEAIIKYKSSEKDYIEKILYGFTDSFEKHGPSYAIIGFIETINILNKDPNYYSFCKDVRRRLTNIDLNYRHKFNFE